MAKYYKKSDSILSLIKHQFCIVILWSSMKYIYLKFAKQRTLEEHYFGMSVHRCAAIEVRL